MKGLDATTYLNRYVRDETARVWILAGSKVGVYVRRDIMKLVDGDAFAAMLLSQIMYYHELDNNGKPRISHVYEGNLWIVKTYDEWCEELGFKSTKTVRNCFARLAENNIIIKEQHKSTFPEHAGKVVTYVRMNWGILGELLRMVGSDVPERAIQELPNRDIQENPDRDIQENPDRDIQENPKRAFRNTETTTETTTERTAKKKDSAGADHDDPFSDFVETLDLDDDDTDMEPEPGDTPEPGESPEPPAEPTQGKKARQKNPLQEAVAYVFDQKPGPFVGTIGGLLTNSKSVKGAWKEYAIDPPMSPEEIVGFGIWYNHEHGETSDKPPTTPSTLYLRVQQFRGHKLYDRAIEKGTERLNKILGIEPEPEDRPAEPTEEVRAEIDNLISDLVDTFTKGSSA